MARRDSGDKAGSVGGDAFAASARATEGGGLDSGRGNRYHIRPSLDTM